MPSHSEYIGPFDMAMENTTETERHVVKLNQRINRTIFVGGSFVVHTLKSNLARHGHLRENVLKKVQNPCF
jgi:hypothetical protein